VLGIEQVRADGARNEDRNNQGQQQRRPTEEGGKQYPDRGVREQRDQTVNMFFRLFNKRVNTETTNKDGNIAKQDRQRMAHDQVLHPFRSR